MIIVTGATGQLGRQVVQQLVTRVGADRVGVSVRDPDQAGDLAEAGVRVRRGDFSDPSSLAHAFEGAEKVLVVSPAVGGEQAIGYSTAAITAAKEAGAQRILYTSHTGVAADSAFPPMRVHAAVEEVLAGCGVPFTSLRNGFYTSSALQQVRGALETGVLTVPQDAPFAWTAHADLAEVAALALSDDDLAGGVLDGTGPALASPELTDIAGVARVASEVTGRPIRHEVLSDEDFRAAKLTQGLPEVAVEMVLGMFVASRRGDFAPAEPVLESVLGRPATPLRTTVEQALA